MVKHRFERMQHGEIVLDLCFSCQAIWFDEFESAQITPRGIVGLFKLIHEHRDAQRLPLRDPLTCPRCNEKLLHGLDVARHGGQFNYDRCLQRHGRFTTFAQFMIEKGFVRQLTGAEIDEIKVRIGTVRCTGCGAPVDIRKDSACTHCRAPIAILDPQAVEQALSGYREAATKQAAPPAPALLAETILYAERERSRQQRERGSGLNADIGDLLLDGVAMVWDLVRR